MLWSRRDDAYRGRVLYSSQLEAAEKRFVREGQVPETPLPHPVLIRGAVAVFVVGFWTLCIGVLIDHGQVVNNGALIFLASLWPLWRYARMYLAYYRVAYAEGVMDLPWQRDPIEHEEPF